MEVVAECWYEARASTMVEVIMEVAVKIRIEKLPEGVYLATSEEVPGLVAQGRTITETLEIARDVIRKLQESRAERREARELEPASDSFDYTLIVGV